MSATTASERARELMVVYGDACARNTGNLTDESIRRAMDATRALLAYLAALEACVAAAREVVRMGAGSNCLTAERNRLFTALAALDAPATEDGR